MLVYLQGDYSQLLDKLLAYLNEKRSGIGLKSIPV